MPNHDPQQRPSVLLLSLPWTTLKEPSLGLGVLKAQLAAHGIPCRVAHLNLRLLKYIARDRYERLAELYGINDSLFSAVLEDGRTQEDQLSVLVDIVRRRESFELYAARDFLGPDDCVDYVRQMREVIVPEYLAECLEVVGASGATMVGFTCLFDQTIASVALAHEVKRVYPEKLVVLGGYALQDPVGTQILKCFPCVDAVAFGDGEESIVKLAHASVAPDELGLIPGVVSRSRDGELLGSAAAAPTIDLDGSPAPDFDDWFADVADIERETGAALGGWTLPVESSRGCWWGEHSHCVFCGIDDETMRYRAKSAPVVREMLDGLHDRYGLERFRFSDYILPRQYYKTLLPDLAAEPRPYTLHWEMKANVREHEVALMRQAGVRAVQPGIESLSTSVLKKMSKGVSGIQNVLTLKLLREHGIEVLYNILYGFPTDEVDEYEELCERISLVRHLPPTRSCMPVLTVRYAPMQQDPDRFGITRPMVAQSQYETIFSREFRDRRGFDLEQYCYTFERPYDLDPEIEPTYARLLRLVRQWHADYRAGKTRLSFEHVGEGVDFVDGRNGSCRSISLGPEHRIVNSALAHTVRSRAQLVDDVAERLDASDALRAIDDLVGERLVLQEGERVVGLALPARCYG